MKNEHHTISYVELAAADLSATKRFFVTAFGWTFTDYGDAYSDAESGIMIGFYQKDLTSEADQGGALVTLYSDDLEASLEAVRSAGGSVIKPIFTFPGGRRFQFTEPSGNEFAVWSNKTADGEAIQ